MSLNIAEAIRQALLNNAPLFALVGARISADFAPNSTPAGAVWIVMSRVSGSEELSLDGDDGLTHPRYQFTIGGTDRMQINAVRDLLVKFNGVEYTYDAGTVDIPELYLLTFLHADDGEHWDPASRTFTTFVDLLVWANT